MRARYFKGISIWAMKSQSTDSWYWRSLLKARELLEEGIKKRVGDGKSIDIWKDRWLPNSGNGKVKTQRAEGVAVQWVSCLFIYFMNEIKLSDFPANKTFADLGLSVRCS